MPKPKVSFLKHSVNANVSTGIDFNQHSRDMVETNVGIEARQETVMLELDLGRANVDLAGPSGAVEVGFKSDSDSVGFAASTELSLARADGELKVTDHFGLVGSANLNANTGIKVGSDGFEVNLLGTGVTLGVGGKYTLNTPFGSAGAMASSNKKHKNVKNHKKKKLLTK
ncbi:hypothetical protein BLOT_014551 [Blomia tropicalis]|nr:hypothetical protein BLOT_014551 [Blomia tropicalis]